MQMRRWLNQHRGQRAAGSSGDARLGWKCASYVLQQLFVPLILLLASAPFEPKGVQSCAASLPFLVPLTIALGFGAIVGLALPGRADAGRFVWCGPAAVWLWGMGKDLPLRGPWQYIRISICGDPANPDSLNQGLFGVPLAACLLYSLGMTLVIRSRQRRDSAKGEARAAEENGSQPG